MIGCCLGAVIFLAWARLSTRRRRVASQKGWEVFYDKMEREYPGLLKRRLKKYRRVDHGNEK